MCMEDVRLGRKIFYAPRQVPVAAATKVQIAGQNPSRVVLIIQAGTVGAFYAPDGLDPSTGVGLYTIKGSPPVPLTVKDHGQMVTSAWFASGDAAPATVTVIEGFLEDK